MSNRHNRPHLWDLGIWNIDDGEPRACLHCGATVRMIRISATLTAEGLPPKTKSNIRVWEFIPAGASPVLTWEMPACQRETR